MGAGNGGEDAAATEAAQPVVLKMELHCAGCAHKVKKAIRHQPGVESVVADVAAKRVVVAGTADAAALKARIEAKTKKAVEIVSAGSGPKKAAAAGEKKADKDAAAAGEKKADKGASPKEEKQKEKEKEKKQPPEEKKPKEVQETVLLKIRLHCEGCADRIRRRIYKIKGVKDVVLDANAKDEVKVTGTMDVPAMVTYLTEKLNRAVEAVAARAKKDGGGDDKKDKGGNAGDKAKGAAGGDDKKDKGKSIDVAGPSTAAAAAFMAPAPAEASTYHVTPPPYAYMAYPPGPAPASYYPYYGNTDGMYGNADGMGANYYPQQQQQHPYPDAGQHQGYPPYPYRFDMAPPPQLFSDENPSACSVM